jgi:hypothetical protein
MENMSFDDFGLLLGVIEIQWFPISWFMVFKSLCYNVISSPILWAFLYTLSMLTWNVKLLFCSLDLVACIIIALSCILLLVRFNLFTACGVYWLDYTCLDLLHDKFIDYSPCVSTPLLFCIWSLLIWSWSKEEKRLCVTMLWLRPIFVSSWCSSSV